MQWPSTSGAAFLPNPLARAAAIALVEIGARSYVPPFLCLAPALLRGTAAAAGIALVNTAFSVGGFLGPSLIGWFKDTTGSASGAFLILAAVSASAGDGSVRKTSKGIWTSPKKRVLRGKTAPFCTTPDQSAPVISRCCVCADTRNASTLTVLPRATAGRQARRAALRRGRASFRSAISRFRRSPGRRRARGRRR